MHGYIISSLVGMICIGIHLYKNGRLVDQTKHKGNRSNKYQWHTGTTNRLPISKGLYIYVYKQQRANESDIIEG